MKYDWQKKEILLNKKSRSDFIAKLKLNFLLSHLGTLTVLFVLLLSATEKISLFYLLTIGFTGLLMVWLGIYQSLRKVNSVKINLMPSELLRAAKEERNNQRVEKEKTDIYIEECKRFDWVETKTPFYLWSWSKQAGLYTAVIAIFTALVFGVLTLLGYLPIPESGWYYKKLVESGKSVVADQIFVGCFFTFIGVGGLYVLRLFVKTWEIKTEKIPKEDEEWDETLYELSSDN